MHPLLFIWYVRTRHARNVRVWPEAAYGWRPADLKYRWNWTFPVAISPHDHTHVYAGTGDISAGTHGGPAIGVLKKRLAAGDKKIGIFYGAAHLKGMEKILTGEMGFKQVGDPQWRTWGGLRWRKRRAGFA